MKNLLSLFICALVLIACSSDDNARVQSIEENPSLKVVSTATITEDLNNFLGESDIVTYSISVKNNGDVNLSGIAINVNFTDITGNTLSLTSGPGFMNADAGSAEGVLRVDETATYSATYIITQSEVDARGLKFSATASGTSPEGQNVSDVSDNGDDSDGNTTDDTTETIIEFNPLIISECHFLNSMGDPYIKFYFDSNGQLYKIYYTDVRTTPNPVYIYNFEFDSEQKLINYTKYDELGVPLWSSDITYDSENRIMSIGSRQIEYVNEGSGYYYELDNYSEEIWTTGDIEYTEIYFSKYSISDSNPILSECSYSYSSEYNIITEEFTEYGDCGDMFWNNYNGNVTSDCSDTDCVNFSHNTITNPLYSTTNLINLYPLVSPFGGNYNLLFFLFSQNNLTLINYSDPSMIAFSYTINENNLPESSTRQYFDVGDTYPVRAYSNYYYQGDEIPE